MTPPAASSSTVLRAVESARLHPCVVRTGTPEGSVLVLGEEQTAFELERLVDDQEPRPRRVQVTTLDADTFSAGPVADCLRRLLAEQRIATIVIADRAIERDAALVEALFECKARGVRIRDSVGLYEELFQKIRLDTLSPGSLLYSRSLVSNRLSRLVKRAMDLVLASVLLVLCAPIMLMVALAVRLDSPGPVLFTQERVGRRGKSFTIFKFRSMRTDAERGTGPVWARADDDRVTRIGGLLRKTHLDELPQLFNVLRGDMSLVGPRPERPCFVEQLRREIPYYELRHHVTPGVTGWAQVEYDYGASVEDAYRKLEYDLYYAMHASPWLDLLILVRTARAVVRCQGR